MAQKVKIILEVTSTVESLSKVARDFLLSSSHLSWKIYRALP